MVEVGFGHKGDIQLEELEIHRIKRLLGFEAQELGGSLKTEHKV